MELLTEGPSGAARVLSAAPPAPEPAPAGQAYLAMTKSIGTKPVDADSMATALQAAWKCRDDEALVVGQAAVTIQVQHDMQSGPSGSNLPADAVDRAVKELEAYRDSSPKDNRLSSLDAKTLEQVARSMHAAAGASTAGASSPAASSVNLRPTAEAIKSTAAQLTAYLNAGADLPEALACISTQYGGVGCDALTLACAALHVQAPASLPAFLRNPGGSTPIVLAKATLTKYFDASTLERATQLMAANGYTRPIDTRAATAAMARLEADKQGTLQYSNDMGALRGALNDALNAATGERGIAWADDPFARDAWDMAEQVVAHQVMASATPSTGQSTAHNLLLALTELQALGAVADATPAHRRAESPSESKIHTDVARTDALTAQLEKLGLLTIDPVTQQLTAPENPYGFAPNSGVTSLDDWTLFNDITRDPSIATLKSDDINDVLGTTGTTSHESAQDAQSELRATSAVLAEFKSNGAFNYQELLAAALRSNSVQQRFSDLAGSVHEKHAVDEVHADAQILKSVGEPADADLTVALYQQKFQSRFEGLVAHGVWNNASGLSVLWEKNDAPRYAIDVGDAYAALGDATTPASQTAAGRSLLGVVAKRMGGNDFVGSSDGSDKYYDLNWSNKDGTHVVNPQLAQDIITSDPHSKTAKYIEEELPTLNRGDSTPSNVPPMASASADATQEAVTQPGTQVITSRSSLIDALGRAYRQTPLANAPADGQQYDGNDKVYGDTTLNQLADSVLASQDVTEPGNAAPIEITLLPMLYWNHASTDNGDQPAAPQQLQLVQVDGRAGRRFVGPADTKAYDSYDAWVQNNGLPKGTLVSQQFLTTAGTGVPAGVMDQTTTGPKQHLDNWQILLKAGEAMVLFPVVGAISVAPFAVPLLGPATTTGLRLVYFGLQTYYAGNAAYQAANAVQDVAANPTSWRTWLSGTMTTTLSALPYVKSLRGVRLDAGARALTTGASSEDPVLNQILQKIGDKRVIVIGGYSGLGYADEAAVEQAVRADLEQKVAAHGAENLIVVGGSTSDGIGDIGYRVAKGFSIDTLGIVSEEARQFGASAYCDDTIYVPDPGQTWSVLAPDGLSYMVTAAADGRGAYFAYGGGDIARDELMEAQRRGIPTVIHPQFAPDPAKLDAKVAKNPAFDGSPVQTSINDGRLRLEP